MTVRNAVEKAREPGKALAEAMADGKVSHGAILRAVGIDLAKPEHQAMLLAAEKYGLDPLLKHIIVIPNKGTYITRDGWLHIAHREGSLDGIEVLEEDETPTHWTARVAVYVKGKSHPFAYRGRYPKSGGNKQYGPEMAVKVAEVASLRRAFPVAGVASYEEQWDTVEANYEQSIDVPVVVEDEAGEVLALEEAG